MPGRKKRVFSSWLPLWGDYVSSWVIIIYPLGKSLSAIINPAIIRISPKSALKSPTYAAITIIIGR